MIQNSRNFQFQFSDFIAESSNGVFLAGLGIEFDRFVVLKLMVHKADTGERLMRQICFDHST